MACPSIQQGNWMDIMKSSSDYDFMRSWHYYDMPQGQAYEPSDNPNIVNRMLNSYSELQHKNLLCNDDIKFHLLVLCHLMGDLHQPLHCGYSEDLGGNRRPIEFKSLKNHNLHSFWDEDIIAIANIKGISDLQPCTDTTKIFNPAAI